MAEKEVLNYKDKVVLKQNGRWYNLYVEGSLVHRNMPRDGGIRVYSSYVRVLKSMEVKND